MDDETRSVSVRIARVVHRLREDRRLSTEELATRSGVDLDELEAFFGAEGDIGLDAVYRLAGALGVPPRHLLDGIEWIPDGKGGGAFRVEDPEDG
jgi:transcriptional regulator with XRE-family HTH domain